MSLLGIIIDERFGKREQMASMGSADEIQKDMGRILDLLLEKSCLDETFADAVPDQFVMAIDCLKPIVTIDQSELLYMHPAVFVALLENGLGSIIGKPEQLVATLRLMDKLLLSLEEPFFSTDETDYLKKSGHFPESVIPVLRKAIEEIHLSRLLKNPSYRASADNSTIRKAQDVTESPIPQNRDTLITPNRNFDQISAIAENQQDFFKRVVRLNKKTQEYERDSQ